MYGIYNARDHISILLSELRREQRFYDDHIVLLKIDEMNYAL